MSRKEELEGMIKVLFNMWVEEKDKEKLTKIRYSGPVFGKEEYSGILDALFADWWSGGKFTFNVEQSLADFSQRDYGLLANSGSSANLILMSAAKELYFKDGDKILTLACGFPTTVNPIITNRLIPVFLDIDLKNLSLSPKKFEEALRKDKKIKGLFIAHTLGFNGEVDEILDIARANNIQVFFDNCDSYGTIYKDKPLPSYGKAATYSFYPAHEISMGEGGAITTNDPELYTVMKGIRGWGKYCSCKQCCIRTEFPNAFCPQNKFTRDSKLPSDYIVNYQYEWLGYNLKPLELQAAILSAQLQKLPMFTQMRKDNYTKLFNFFKGSNYNIQTWSLPDNVSPFAFPILMDSIKRGRVVKELNRLGVETRFLFGGNLMLHPAYINNSSYWEAGELSYPNSDRITEECLLFGVSQINDGLAMDLMIEKIDKVFGNLKV